MAIYKPYNEKLRNLLEQIRKKELVLPEFQRDFVWEPEEIVELLISVTKTYPCGSLLFLNTGGTKKFAYRPIGDKKKSDRLPRLMVLDGQQRLTSMYHAFYECGDIRFYFDVEKLGEDNISDDTFYYYYEAERIEKLPEREDEFDEYLLPLSTVFSTKYDFEDWFDDFLDYHKKSGNNCGLDKNDTKRIKRKYINAIRDYEFPILEVPENVPDNVVCEIFEVLNRTGTPLNVFELLTAKLWTKGVHLRDMWQKAQTMCPNLSRYGIDSVTFLRSLSMLSRKDSRACKAEFLYKLVAKDFSEYWDDLIEAYNELFVILREELGVLQGKWIPYKLLAPVMAAAIVRLNRDYTRLAKSKRKENLKAWYWKTTFHEYITIYTESRAGSSFLDLVNWFDKGIEPDIVKDFSFDPKRLLMSSPSKALYKGILNMLALNGARDFHAYDFIRTRFDMDSTIDDHHIFPRRYLEKKKVDSEEVNCVVNRTLIDAETNSSIGSKKPSKYLKIIEDNIGSRRLNTILRSHCIVSKSNQAIFEDDFHGFFEFRKKQLVNMITRKCRE